MISGRILVCLEHITPYASGFNLLSHGVSNWEDGFKERLQKMFPASAEKEEYGSNSFTESYAIVPKVTESYHKYKREFVKHLCFNPEEENLSKCIFDFSSS